VFTIATDSPDLKAQWMASLQQSIQDVNNKAATLRSQMAAFEEKKTTMRQARAQEEHPKPAEPVGRARVASQPRTEVPKLVKSNTTQVASSGNLKAAAAAAAGSSGPATVGAAVAVDTKAGDGKKAPAASATATGGKG
jgi:hypothetical protein